MNPGSPMLRRTRSLDALATGLALFLGTTLAAAEELQLREQPVPAETRAERSGDQHVVAEFDAFARVNPLGLALLAGVYYRNVWSRDRDAHYETAYVQAGAAGLITPAYGQLGAHVEILPLPFLVLRADYALQAFVGANRGLIGFERADQAFGDAELDARDNQAKTALAHRIGAEVVLRAKVGRFVARNTSQLYYYHYRTSQPYVYESEFDTLLENSDELWNNRLQFGVDVSSQATPALTLLGPFYEITRSFGSDIRRQRVGGFFYMEGESWLGLQKPRVYALSGLNLEDRNRQGSLFFLLGVGTNIGD